MGKRTVAVSVKMSEEDFDLLKRRAAEIWPNAIMTNSGMLLSFALLGAELTRKPTTKASTKKKRKR